MEKKGLKQAVAKEQKRITENSNPEPVKTIKRKVFIYFISFWWKQGKDTGFACYEQGMVDKVEHLGQLMQSAQAYGVQLQKSMQKIKKELPWYKFLDKIRIDTRPYFIYPLEFKLLREDYEKVPVIVPEKKGPVEVH